MVTIIELLLLQASHTIDKVGFELEAAQSELSRLRREKDVMHSKLREAELLLDAEKRSVPLIHHLVFNTHTVHTVHACMSYYVVKLAKLCYHIHHPVFITISRNNTYFEYAHTYIHTYIDRCPLPNLMIPEFFAKGDGCNEAGLRRKGQAGRGAESRGEGGAHRAGVQVRIAGPQSTYQYCYCYYTIRALFSTIIVATTTATRILFVATVRTPLLLSHVLIV